MQIEPEREREEKLKVKEMWGNSRGLLIFFPKGEKRGKQNKEDKKKDKG